jgi:hypothetical protein
MGRDGREEEEHGYWLEARRNLRSEWKLIGMLAASAAEAVNRVVRERSRSEDQGSR